jgi:hypothetical protein
MNCVVVEIGDNGTGISPEIKSHIFEPFFTTKGVGDGTGLGLDTVQRIVKKHKGNIQVISKPGDTRFQVRLPLAEATTVEEKESQLRIKKRRHFMATITTKDGTTIYYKDWGKGQPVVSATGWPLSADDWDGQMLYFGQLAYRVIAHDRRGHGRSTHT